MSLSFRAPTISRPLVFCLALLGLPTPVHAAQEENLHQRLAREIFRELVEIDTSTSTGNMRVAAQAMKARLTAAGFRTSEVRVLGPSDRHGNLVARFEGAKSDGRPILLMAHLDVVDANEEGWSADPFLFVERDGYFYGRGTRDNKAGAAILVANLIRLKRQGFVPCRPLILMLTADEESGGANGTDWLLRNHRDLIEADFSLDTDGGDGVFSNGERFIFAVQPSEKIYQSFQLAVFSNGGHSSLPVKDNAIHLLATGLERLAQFGFPVQLNEVTRAFFRRMAELETGQVASDMRSIVGSSADPEAASRLAQSPYFNALMRTTCVATRLEGGHADNALPRVARALVNCRMLPDTTPDEIGATLRRVIANDRVEVKAVVEAGAGGASPTSPLRSDIMDPIERLVAIHFPEATVIPAMGPGATDGYHLRRAGIPTYGVSAFFDDKGDVRMHGKDERVGMQDFYDALGFWYDLIREISSCPEQ